MRRLAVVLLLSLLCAGAASSAQASDWHYAGERDATSNTLVMAAARYGSTFLAAHGYRQCATTRGTIRVADDLGGVQMADGTVEPAAGRALDCDVWLQGALVDAADPFDMDSMSTLCAVVTHELAHTAGMSHEDMASTGLEKRWTRTCLGWAVKVWQSPRRMLRARR